MRVFDCISMNHCYTKAVCQIETNGIEVIIGGDQPQSPAAMAFCKVANCCNQGGADASFFQEAI